jgi:hypothetical protein
MGATSGSMGAVTEVPAPPPQKPTPPEQKAAPSSPSVKPAPLAPPEPKPAPSSPSMRSAPPAQRKRPGEGIGSAIGNGLAAATGGLVRLTSKIFGEVAERAGTSMADFRARPEHSRWRAYALGSYGAIVAATLVGQLYTDNALQAYVRVQPVELPALTEIFVRNDSRRAWSNVKVTLNGIYAYEQPVVAPGAFILLPVNKFAVYDGMGKPTYAPKNIVPKQLSIDTSEQHFETELK